MTTWIGTSSSEEDIFLDFCNEHSVSIRVGELLDQLSDYHLINSFHYRQVLLYYIPEKSEKPADSEQRILFRHSRPDGYRIVSEGAARWRALVMPENPTPMHPPTHSYEPHTHSLLNSLTAGCLVTSQCGATESM
jgi:hypothetical protein